MGCNMASTSLLVSAAAHDSNVPVWRWLTFPYTGAANQPGEGELFCYYGDTHCDRARIADQSLMCRTPDEKWSKCDYDLLVVFNHDTALSI